MGILDDAIREHLELKRQAGADDSELKQLEDQAFGQSERPGAEAQAPAAGDGDGTPLADSEAPTEFMAQPDLGEGETDATPPEVALNQEPPAVRREPAAGVADIQEAPAKESSEEEAARRGRAAGGRGAVCRRTPGDPRAAERPRRPQHRGAPRDRRPADADV